MIFPLNSLLANVALDLVKRGSDTNSAINNGWDQIWQDSILNVQPNSPYWMVAEVARLIAAIGIIAFAINWSSKYAYVGPAAVLTQIPNFLGVAILIAALSNHAAPAANLSYALNRLIIYSNQQIMNQQVSRVTFETAVKSMQLIDQAKAAVRDEYNKCVNIKPELFPSQDAKKGVTANSDHSQTKCFKDLESKLTQMQSDFQAENCNGIKAIACDPAIRVLEDARKGVGNAFTSTIRRSGNNGILSFNDKIFAEELGKQVGNYVASKALLSILPTIMYAFQFVYMNTLVGGLYICGLSSPIFIAASFLPFTPRLCWSWLIYFLHFGLAIFWYSVLIGLAATLLVNAKGETLLDLQYALFIGIGAVGLSGGLAYFSANAAVQSAAANNQSLASMAVNTISNVALSVMRFIPFL